MNQKDFKQRINTEVENAELSDRPYQMAEKAFYERQARPSASNSSDLKKNRPLLILSSAVVFSLAIFGIIFWAIMYGKSDNKVFFNSQTPFISISFDEISQYTDKEVALPHGFDSDFEIKTVRVFFPKENEPCAIEIAYQRNDDTISVMIMIDNDYEYYNKDEHMVCDTPLSRNGAVGYYSVYPERNRIMAQFEKAGAEYYFLGNNIDLSVFENFVDSLEL